MAKEFRYDTDFPVITTTTGKVHGYEYDHVMIFKGIPYAKAERFRAPEKVSWEGVLEATSYGYGCPTIEEPVPDHNLDFDRHQELKNECCQVMNIWTPGLDAARRPVLVWLHGGGMSFGSSSEDGLCEGEEMARHGDVVVVSFNHRLNILGFCDLSDFGEQFANSGNAGVADMVMALEWVRDNIEYFGGDPGNVTLFGQSGGGLKVTTLLQTPAADGLFHKGIIISGVAGGAMCDCVGSGRQMGKILMRECGVETAEELAEVPIGDLMMAARVMRRELKFRGPNAGEFPLRGEYYLGDPLEVSFRAETADIPLLVGSTFGEFNAPKSYGIHKNAMGEAEQEKLVWKTFGEKIAGRGIELFRKAYPERQVVDLVSMDYMFRNYVNRYMERRAALNHSTWNYIFNLDMPMMGGVSPLHGNDLGFIFHTTGKAPALQEPGITEKVEDQVFRSVIAFARTGNPNHEGLPQWDPSSPDAQYTMLFGKCPEVRMNFDVELNNWMAENLLADQVQEMMNAVAGRL